MGEVVLLRKLLPTDKLEKKKEAVGERQEISSSDIFFAIVLSSDSAWIMSVFRVTLF